MKNNTKLLHYFALFLMALLFNTSYAKPLVAVGTWTHPDVDRPLVAVSQDVGLHWYYPPSANVHPVDPSYSRGMLHAVSCNTRLCAAAGTWMDKNALFRPLITWSADEGLSWHYMDMLYEGPVLPRVQDSRFHDVNCTDTFCMAAGFYTETDHNKIPLLARSQFDPEVSWNFLQTTVKNALPDNFLEGEFEHISCNSNFCVAAGNYANKQGHRFPLLMQSDKTGKHWHAVKPNMPKDFTEGTFQSIHCDDHICIATGQYIHSTWRKPLLTLSTDQGKTWHSAPISLPEGHREGELMHASCNNTWCVATGLLFNRDNDNAWPFLVFSNDNGKTWHHSDYISNTGLPEDFLSGRFSHSACNTKICIASGYYFGGDTLHPLIAVSEDQGKTWHYPPSALESTPAAFEKDGTIFQVYCNESICMAAGDFIYKDGWYEEMFPLLSISHDQGKNWDYPAYINTLDNLPKGFFSGHFMSVG